MYFNYIVPIYMLLSNMWLIVYIVYSVYNYDLLSANESGTCKLIKFKISKEISLSIYLTYYNDSAMFIYSI